MSPPRPFVDSTGPEGMLAAPVSEEAFGLVGLTGCTEAFAAWKLS